MITKFIIRDIMVKIMMGDDAAAGDGSSGAGAGAGGAGCAGAAGSAGDVGDDGGRR